MTLTKKQLTVKYEDKKITLNRDLIKSQNAHENLEDLKRLHKLKMVIETVMENKEIKSTADVDYLKEGDRILTSVEFMLQELWGFSRSDKFHRFWERPKCACPKMDNDDRYPTGIYVISGACILHGSDIK